MLRMDTQLQPGKRSYSGKTMIGNWLEDRSVYADQLKPPLFSGENEAFQTTQNAAVREIRARCEAHTVQPIPREQDTHFQTEYSRNFASPQCQSPVHRLYQPSMTRDQQKLEEYRQRWTRGTLPLPESREVIGGFARSRAATAPVGSSKGHR